MKRCLAAEKCGKNTIGHNCCFRKEFLFLKHRICCFLIRIFTRFCSEITVEFRELRNFIYYACYNLMLSKTVIDLCNFLWNIHKIFFKMSRECEISFFFSGVQHHYFKYWIFIVEITTHIVSLNSYLEI